MTGPSFGGERKYFNRINKKCKKWPCAVADGPLFASCRGYFHQSKAISAIAAMAASAIAYPYPHPYPHPQPTNE